MSELPQFLAKLVAQGKISFSQLSDRSRDHLRPLLDGGVLVVEVAGRGEIVRVSKAEVFTEWLRNNYPGYERQWIARDTATRATAVALRRDSKATRRGVAASVLHFRASDPHRGKVMLNGRDFPVRELTQRYGVAACLIDGASVITIEGRAALIENLECFLEAERILPDVAISINSTGRISDRLITCLDRSSLSPGPLWHLPDYDPVGLSDYLRLRSQLGDRVALFIPRDVERRFAALANHKLLTEKPRNRVLLQKLARVSWPCNESERIFRLIKESGRGLEQESLLLDTS